MTSPAAAPETQSDTPLTDAAEKWFTGEGPVGVETEFARDLERTIASMRQEVGRLEGERDALKHDMEQMYDSLNGEANARIEAEKQANLLNTANNNQAKTIREAEARVRELEGQWNDARDIAGKGPNVLVARELIKEWTARLAAAEADKLDAQRYRYYMGRLFDPKGDWPLEFQDAQSLDELNTAIDTAAAKQGA